MSELVTPLNGSAGGVFESSRMFQIASAAGWSMTRLVVSFSHRFIVPGARPMRGSGLGGEVDMSAWTVPVSPPDVEDDDAQAAAYTPKASSMIRSPDQRAPAVLRSDRILTVTNPVEG